MGGTLKGAGLTGLVSLPRWGRHVTAMGALRDPQMPAWVPPEPLTGVKTALLRRRCAVLTPFGRCQPCRKWVVADNCRLFHVIRACRKILVGPEIVPVEDRTSLTMMGRLTGEGSAS